MKRKQSELPSYLMKELSALKPPKKMTVSQWADRFRILSEKNSAAPGPWRTEKTPYLKAVMDAFSDPMIQEITFCAGTQIGKTASEQNMQGYAIDQDPGPMIIVYPTKDLAKSTSENRLKPMIELSPALYRKFHELESEQLELQFDSMYIALAWANSPSQLASRPVRYVFFDEVDKFPKWSGKEANPIALARERTKTFYNRKIVKVSTPVLENGNIWQSWMNSDARYEYFLPCPFCGKLQTLKNRQIKFPMGSSPEEAAYTSYYECEFCHGHIDDRHKMGMLRDGKWKRIDKNKGRVRSVGFHLNSIYSPWLTFGDVAKEFISTKDKPELLQNFINSWLAEPWREKSKVMSTEIVKKNQMPYEKGYVKQEAQIVTMAVDVQLDHFWWAIYAWGTHMKSWLVDWGRATNWDEIAKIMNRDYPRENTGEAVRVDIAGIDAGFRRDEVEQFCTDWLGVAVPMRGSSRGLKTLYMPYNVDKGPNGTGTGLRGIMFDTTKAKDFIFARYGRNSGDAGSMNVYDGIEDEFCAQVCSEQKIEHEDRKGNVAYSWEKLTSHTDNHLLDCSTMNYILADVCGARYLMEQNRAADRQEPKGQDHDFTGWFDGAADWFKQ